MSRSAPKHHRWLDLIAFLAGRRLPVAVEELMERVPAYAAKWVEGGETARATARRTFERDKDELRRLGIPIETVTYSIDYGLTQAEGYVLRRRDFYLPYLKLIAAAGPEAKPYVLDEVELTEPEAEAALDALRHVAALPAFPFAEEARSAFRKLAFDLDPEAFHETPILHVERPGAAEVLERLRPLTDALLARKTVSFRYCGIHRGRATDREVRPYGLFFQSAHWYLAGHDAGREALRVFRVDRIEEIEVNEQSPNTPDYDVPDDFRLEHHIRREAWELGEEEPLRARVRFRFPLSLWADRNRHGRLEAEQEDGSAIRAFEVQQVSPFLRWVLGLGGDAELLSPAELAAELHRMADEVAALYASGAR